MNFKNFIVISVMSTMFFGCGKVEPPTEETQTVKPKSNYTLDHKTAKAKKVLDANVTVVDDETGIAIDNAKVRRRVGLAIDFAEKIEAGGYYLSTNSLKKLLYVGALADGYIPNDIRQPKFPLEIRLKKGQTVTVSGEIIDEYGNPVTQGIINLGQVDDLRWKQILPKFYPCSVYINEQGKFKLTNVPANYEDICARYECQGEPELEFKDQLFDIKNEDIYLKLQLKAKTTLKGRVIYSSGESVSGAWVWIEKVVGKELDPWNKLLTLRMFHLDKVAVCTQADGEFEITINKPLDKYSLKAHHPLYLAATKGPYSAGNPPPEMVELVINNSGTRIAGRFWDQNNEPVLNAYAYYPIRKKMGGTGYQEMPNDLTLDTDENGEYISGLLPSGITEINFSAPDCQRRVIKVNLTENEVNILDVQFVKNVVVIATGTVYNADIQQPLPGVTVNFFGGSTITTDANGKFCFTSNKLTFSAPGYGTFSKLVHVRQPNQLKTTEEVYQNSNHEFFMSPSCAVRISVADAKGYPLDGNIINLNYRYRENGSLRGPEIESINGQKLINGEVLFTNLSSHLSPVHFSIRDFDNKRDLAKIQNLELKAGSEIYFSTNLPARGNLVLEFKKTFPKRNINVYLHQIFSDDPKYNYYNSSSENYYFSDFKIRNQSLILNEVPTNRYSLSVGSSYENFLKTNIFISVDKTQVIKIDNDIEEGAIKGTIKTISGKKIPYKIGVRSQGKVFVNVHSLPTYEQSFNIDKLSKKYLYTLRIWTDFNSTNIVIKDLKPDCPDINIVLPEAFALTGNVIDEEGQPLQIKIGIKRASQSYEGEFKLYPIFAGRYKIVIKANGYVGQSHDVIINNSNVDLGEIVLIKKSKENNEF